MNQNFMEQLKTLVLPEQIFMDEPMKKHTTFRIGGPADVLVCPKEEQIADILQLAKQYEIAVTVIGNGSNLLVSDAGIRGLVLEIGKYMADVSVTGNQIHAGAGALLSKVARCAMEASLGGMEFAAGIPGTIGGAVVMNAGAYGREMKDILLSATVLTSDGKLLTLPVKDLDLAYRHSCILQNSYIVVSTKLQLEPKEQKAIAARMEELKAQRVEKQPLEYPSAGSTFKRPEGFFAGKLIMDAGLRGYRVGDAQVSEKHCGFVINAGNATAQQVMQLIEDVKQKVFDEFEVELEPEVKIIGE